MKPIHHSLFFAVLCSIIALPVTAFAQNADFTSTFLATGTFSSSPALNGTANSNLGGTRMLWYPKKAAFRAGSASAAQWTDESIGNYSVALGQDTTASGANSTAFGVGSVASGPQATAFGNGTTASAYGATSMGVGTKSSYVSTAIGIFNTGLGSTTQWNPSDPLFEIGNGFSDSTRSNALTVRKNGSVDIQATLFVGATIYSANSPVLTLASAVSNRFVQASPTGSINVAGITVGGSNVVTTSSIFNYNYLNSSQVSTLISARGYLTSAAATTSGFVKQADVDLRVASFGYQTAAQVETTLGTKNYVTPSNIGTVISTQAQVELPETTIQGDTVLNGKVIISVPQGDISMGIYQ